MEISAPAPRQIDWRTATLVASGIAALELVVLLVIAIAMLSKPLSAHAKEAGLTQGLGSPEAEVRPEPKTTTLSRRATSVLVLNGNGITGAAAEAASRVRARGYTKTATGNTAQSYGQSVVMYRPGRRPEAQRLAGDLGVRLVGPLDGIGLRGLQGAQVVLVLGAS